MSTRVQIPACTDRWMLGDRFGEIVKVVRGDCCGEVVKVVNEVAHVRLDRSGKTVRVILADCEVVS